MFTVSTRWFVDLAGRFAISRDIAFQIPGKYRKAALLAGLFGFLFAGALAFGQGQTIHDLPSTAKKSRVSLPHLYWHFLIYQNHLERAATAHEQQGKDGSWLRDHFRKRIGLTDPEFNALRDTGMQLETDLKAIDSRAAGIVQQDREWLRLNGRNGASGPPPGHFQLQQLRIEREATIQRHVDRLNESLSPASAAKLRSFLENEWASNVTVRKVPLRTQPPLHDGKNHPMTLLQEQKP